MKRIPPNEKEVTLYVTYFWDRLKPSSPTVASVPTVTSETNGIVSLEKQPAYTARRELQNVQTSADLIRWADTWISLDDWRKARDTVRAWRYKARNKLVRASMREATKKLLDDRSQHYGMPLWRYLENLNLTDEKLSTLESQSKLIPHYPLSD